jgi:S-adenosylmethionine synthetase
VRWQTAAFDNYVHVKTYTCAHHAGLTGRQIVSDTYGGWVVGGGKQLIVKNY